MPAKIATVIGSTGLIGSHLLNVLQNDNVFETIRAVVRKPVRFQQSKVEMKLVNFDEPESVKLAIDGSDAVFCAVGTTQKKVKGDKAAYRKVDYDIPVNAAIFCAETGCPNFLLVSSVGANSMSNNFYLKLKGEVEDAVQKLSIQNISIFRPSILLGKRDEKRAGEKVGQAVMSFFAFLLVGSWDKYKPIEAEKVARAMVTTAKEQNSGTRIYEYEAIRKLSSGPSPTAIH
ncbi:NAD(P)H-binding protein [Flavisolibacter ginsenosidimutans]|uniref:NAD-dependent epimerase/dehydratase family protein n=1 Tax=Flavisolibacter ginsenosidimutans TaxID=661481 RepID=A0A5B8UGD4_9BACT|nr:NAD(P)H-binding protein [Flavisolibacter ginsenosidimutans]QEC55199.1 NAD-dependent epimerase/dehydratase family protein [Flavisolibacter ginsenosidimutans]